MKKSLVVKTLSLILSLILLLPLFPAALAAEAEEPAAEGPTEEALLAEEPAEEPAAEPCLIPERPSDTAGDSPDAAAERLSLFQPSRNRVQPARRSSP